MVSTPAAIRIDLDGTLTHLPDAEYTTLRDAVGGLIEVAPSNGTVEIFLNEEGKLKHLAPNPVGIAFWAMVDRYGCIPGREWIAGPCVVAGPLAPDGNTTPIPGWVEPILTEIRRIYYSRPDEQDADDPPTTPF